MIYTLPITQDVGGISYEIRSDYRAVLDICAALSDAEMSDQDKGIAVLTIFYPSYEEMPTQHYQEAIQACFRFINCGEDCKKQSKPTLMNWQQDFKYIVAPINKVCGCEIRAVEYMHWWTFIAGYYEIGDCLFAQIIRIREKKSSGKPLDKAEQEWYRNNRELVDLNVIYTEAEENVLKEWGV